MMAAEQMPDAISLAVLLDGLADLTGLPDVPVHGLSSDTRAVRSGDLFLAVAGAHQHGLDSVQAALDAGAVAVVWEAVAGDEDLAKRAAALPVPQLALWDLRQQLGIIADRFYGAPSRDLFLVGVTGTDGKTSCTHFLAEACSEPHLPGGLLGTLGYGAYGRLKRATHTTPDALVVQRELAELRDAGLRQVAMEVSSHGLHQGRVNGVRFDVAVFTNLSRDHLDYHGDEAAYADAKRLLFQWPDLQAAVINGSDSFGRTLLREMPAGVRTVAYGMTDELEGVDVPEYVLGHDLCLDAHGLRVRVNTPWGEGHLQAGLLGGFNASNLLAALAVLGIAGMPLTTALRRLSQVHTVPGRMERYGGGVAQALVVVDYAHTPRALEQVLLALRAHCHGALWCVFGAGGDRDAGKRPLMGAVAERLADHLVLTNDNPRGEPPEQILEHICAGLAHADAAHIIPDRGRAIRTAIQAAGPGDLVLVAGKGHEDYQLVGELRLPFSDRAQVAACLAENGA